MSSLVKYDEKLTKTAGKGIVKGSAFALALSLVPFVGVVPVALVALIGGALLWLLT